MNRTKFLIMALAATVLALLPLSASVAASADVVTPITSAGSAAPSGIQAQWPGECRHPWTWVRRETGIFAEPNVNATIIGSVSAAPTYIACRALVIGGRYNGCDGQNANGWILIPVNPAPRIGYIISTCTEDRP